MSPVRRPAALALAVTATLALGGCGSDSSGQGGQGGGSGQGGASASASPSPQATAAPVPPLTFVKEAPKDNCYALGVGKKNQTGQVAWFQSAVNVTASGRLVDVTATDADGVTIQLADTQQVPLAGQEDSAGDIGEWPLRADDVGRFIVVRDAGDLVDVDLRANQTFLPALHLEVERGSSVGAFVFTYEASNGQRQEVTYPADLSFPRKCD